MKRLVALVAVLFAFAWASVARAEPVRILVSAGSKLGLPAERPLKFASNDATRVRDVMTSLGGVKPENAFLLTEPTRAQLFAAIDKAKAEAKKHRSEEVALVFYFSGHGDRDALHLGSDRVAISDVSAKLAEVPASLRIAVTDACRATRDKGFTADEPFAISATMIPQASGQVWLHASSDGEAAQESDELQGALFTHAWINGLRGAADANGDARVTLDESFAFAHSQTLIRSAKSSGVLQKPEAIVSLREGGPVVLTQTTARMGTLSLPQARDVHFLVYSAGAKSVMSELWGSPDRRLLIRVPPGRYVVHRRVGQAGGLATIAVGEREERRLEANDFASRPLEMLARKGGEADEPALTPRSDLHLEIAVGWDVGQNSRTGFVHGPRAGYAYAWRHVALTIGGGADFASRSLESRTRASSAATAVRASSSGSRSARSRCAAAPAAAPGCSRRRSGAPARSSARPTNRTPRSSSVRRRSSPLGSRSVTRGSPISARPAACSSSGRRRRSAGSRAPSSRSRSARASEGGPDVASSASMAKPKEELPVRPGTATDPESPREIENPGDPGPTVLVPPDEKDTRQDPKLPPTKTPQPGV